VLSITVSTGSLHCRPMSLTVQVEDINRNNLNAKEFIQTVKCTQGSVVGIPAPLVPGSQPGPNTYMQPLVDISTLELPADQARPSSLLVWGLPGQKGRVASYTPSMQDMEIYHGPVRRNVTYTDTANMMDDGNSLVTLEEVDFLAEDSSDTLQSRGRQLIKPIKTRLILSGAELNEKLADLRLKQNLIEDKEDDMAEKIEILSDQQRNNSQFIRNFFGSLMTANENQNVFGKN